MAQYIHDNTDDEKSHAAFLKAYLESKGAEAVDLSPFATIPGSTATGSTGKTRLTNLTKLTVDTSFWSQYRSITNPDFDPGAKFVPAVPSLNVAHIQPSQERTLTPPAVPSAVTLPAASPPTSRQSPSPRGPTLHLSGQAVPASIQRSRRRSPTWKFYGSCLASVQARLCTFKPGRIRQAMPFR